MPEAVRVIGGNQALDNLLVTLQAMSFTKKFPLRVLEALYNLCIVLTPRSF